MQTWWFIKKVKIWCYCPCTIRTSVGFSKILLPVIDCCNVVSGLVSQLSFIVLHWSHKNSSWSILRNLIHCRRDSSSCTQTPLTWMNFSVAVSCRDIGSDIEEQRRGIQNLYRSSHTWANKIKTWFGLRGENWEAQTGGILSYRGNILWPKLREFTNYVWERLYYDTVTQNIAHLVGQLSSQFW